jgi:hypothetical protein
MEEPEDSSTAARHELLEALAEHEAEESAVLLSNESFD